MKLNYNKAEFSAAYGKFSQIPAPERIEIAFAGHSNVGKSTLINKLFNRKNLARVSSVPGKTVTINFFSLDGIYLADLPGYGYAKVSKGEKRAWSGLIGGYLADERRQLAFGDQQGAIEVDTEGTVTPRALYWGPRFLWERYRLPFTSCQLPSGSCCLPLSV